MGVLVIFWMSLKVSLDAYVWVFVLDELMEASEVGFNLLIILEQAYRSRLVSELLVRGCVRDTDIN